MFSKDTGYYTSLARKDAWTKAALQSRELISIKLRKNWPHRHFMDAIRMSDWFMPVQPQFRINICERGIRTWLKRRAPVSAPSIPWNALGPIS